jgi:hypothetical protein
VARHHIRIETRVSGAHLFVPVKTSSISLLGEDSPAEPPDETVVRRDVIERFRKWRQRMEPSQRAGSSSSACVAENGIASTKSDDRDPVFRDWYTGRGCEDLLPAAAFMHAKMAARILPLIDARHDAQQVWSSMYDDAKHKVRAEALGHPTDIFDSCCARMPRAEPRNTAALFSCGSYASPVSGSLSDVSANSGPQTS